MQTYLFYYLIGINIVAFLVMWQDKRKAIRKQYRISERTLFVLALLGGSIGSIVGMQRFRHKTKHWTFKLGMPLILILQVIIYFMLIRPSLLG